jgi:hypothetical protein
MIPTGEPCISDGLPSLEKEYAADNWLPVKQWGVGAAKHFCFVDSGVNKNRRL